MCSLKQKQNLKQNPHPICHEYESPDLLNDILIWTVWEYNEKGLMCVCDIIAQHRQKSKNTKAKSFRSSLIYLILFSMIFYFILFCFMGIMLWGHKFIT